MMIPESLRPCIRASAIKRNGLQSILHEESGPDDDDTAEIPAMPWPIRTRPRTERY